MCDETNSETDKCTDKYGMSRDDFDNPDHVKVCDNCNCFTASLCFMNESVVFCSACYDEVMRECYVCGSHFPFGRDIHNWYYDPIGLHKTGVCDSCGRQEDKRLESHIRTNTNNNHERMKVPYKFTNTY